MVNRPSVFVPASSTLFRPAWMAMGLLRQEHGRKLISQSHVVVVALERAANQGAFHCHDRQRPTSSNRCVELGVMYSMGAPALSSSTLCLWPWYPSRAAIWSLIGPSSSVYG